MILTIQRALASSNLVQFPSTLGHMNGMLFQFVVTVLAGSIQRNQQHVIEYLLKENRVLREQLGKKRLRLTNNQRRRLAVETKTLGRAGLNGIACIVTPDTSTTLVS